MILFSHQHETPVASGSKRRSFPDSVGPWVFAISETTMRFGGLAGLSAQRKFSEMSRTPARFTQAEINRAVRAAKQADADTVVELRPDGVIYISFNGKKPPPDEDDGGDVVL